MLSDLDIPHDPECSAYYTLEAKNGFNGEDYLAGTGSAWVPGRTRGPWVFSEYISRMGRSCARAEGLGPAFPQVLQG